MDAHKTSLNVRDALSYLDRVKFTFADQTQVYDRFLTQVPSRPSSPPHRHADPDMPMEQDHEGL